MTSNPIYVPLIQSAKTLKFIEKAVAKHGDRYDYSLVEYINNHTKVKIICPHGVFEQSPAAHLVGKGCAECSKDRRRVSEIAKYAIDFINRANILHNYCYDYSKVNYVDMKTAVVIICKTHGEFLQTPDKHLRPHGCLHCANDRCSKRLQKTTDAFKMDAFAVHGDLFDYTYSIYAGSRAKINIRCKIHGVFAQNAANHLRGKGCPKCSGRISKISTKWLDSLNIASIIREYDIPEHEFYKPVDGYDPLTNTVYQFHGDYWHGNPAKYNPIDIHPEIGKSFGELNRLTNESDDWIRSQGYNLIVMWEMDFKTSP